MRKVFGLLSAKHRIHHGGCRGTDKQCEQFWHDCQVYEADWGKHGRAAGPIRNRKMLEHVELLIAFPGGRGTEDCIRAAHEQGIPVLRVEP